MFIDERLWRNIGLSPDIQVWCCPWITLLLWAIFQLLRGVHVAVWAFIALLVRVFCAYL